MQLINKIKNSSKELSSIENLCICAMMLALRVVIGIFANFTLSFSPFAKISLNFIPIVATAYLFGPIPCAIVSACGDLLSIFILNPSAAGINPLITLCCLIEGLIYGFILYKCEIKYSPIIIAKTIVLIISQLILYSLVLYLIYQTSIWAILLNRVLVLIPFSIIEIFIDFYILKLIEKINKGRPK